ncbi:division/cell wall cluster transcriptional repressor MraZ [Rurimicrobium arvi]
MSHLIGEYELTLDAKGRFLLPSAFRKQLPEGADAQFVVSKGFEQCLNLYTMDEWNQLSEKINKLNDFNPQVRAFKRLFFNGANIVEADAAGRLLLNKPLVEHAQLSKDIVLTAQGSKVEIWDKKLLDAHIQSKMGDFSDLANEVLGGGFISPFESM